jgi:hypothetical protein
LQGRIRQLAETEELIELKGEWRLDIETLKKACEKYWKEEGRASFYDVALQIVDEYPLQASIIILATWNMNRFRFFASDSENLVNLKNAIEECKPWFEQLKGRSFKTIKFDEFRDTIRAIYSRLSKVSGVEYTGASKVMHLLNRDLFVMWDTDTRDEYGFYEADANDYFSFLKKMQEKFKDIEWNIPNKTLAKAVDEYNQVNITIPRMEKRGRRKKKDRREFPLRKTEEKRILRKKIAI